MVIVSSNDSSEIVRLQNFVSIFSYVIVKKQQRTLLNKMIIDPRVTK